MPGTFDILRGRGNPPGESGLAVHTAQSRLVFDVGQWAAGTLYLRTVNGARTNGVVAFKHAPAANTPTGEWQDFSTAVSFTAAGFAEVDLVGKAFVALMPSTTETGGTWNVEAFLVVQGDA
jgi:hypothetical protein